MKGLEDKYQEISSLKVNSNQLDSTRSHLYVESWKTTETFIVLVFIRWNVWGSLCDAISEIPWHY